MKEKEIYVMLTAFCNMKLSSFAKIAFKVFEN